MASPLSIASAPRNLPGKPALGSGTAATRAAIYQSSTDNSAPTLATDGWEIMNQTRARLCVLSETGTSVAVKVYLYDSNSEQWAQQTDVGTITATTGGTACVIKDISLYGADRIYFQHTETGDSEKCSIWCTIWTPLGDL